jgi:GT2 family glycosyltransferase
VGQAVVAADGDPLAAIARAAGWPLWSAWLRAARGEQAAPPPAPAATVAICTRARPVALRRCLESLARLPDDGQEILVVDSASRDPAAVAAVAAEWPRARCLRLERAGLDVARNAALAAARHELVAFVDDDAVVERDWLRALLAPFAAPEVTATTALVLPLALDSAAQERFERRFGFGRGFEGRSLDAGVCSPLFGWRAGVGAAMALRRRPVLDELGGFDEALDVGTPTHGGGENDLFSRLLGRGHRIVYRPGAVAWHEHGGDERAERRKFGGYATAAAAFLGLRTVVDRLPQAPLEWLRDLDYLLARLLRGAFGRPGVEPPRAVAAQLAGWAGGAFALVRSRLRLRRSRR